MGKNIILNQLNENVAYDKLYPAGAVDYTFLSKETSDAYNLENGTVKDAISGLNDYISHSNVVSLKVVDSRGTPLEGIQVVGISGNPRTDADGFVSGVANTNSLILMSPYVDTENKKTVDVSKYINTLKILTIVMNNVAENYVVRYNTSQQVKFSSKVKSIDICCVGGGGGGMPNYQYYFGTEVQYSPGGGGGGGGIINGLNVVPQPETMYDIIVGVGGNIGGSYGESAGDGGTSSFMNVYAAGGKGASKSTGGKAGAAHCGDGGRGDNAGITAGNGGNSTESEFDEGKIFYSGGGAGGKRYRYSESNIVSFNGGSPNGANGGAASLNSGRINATKAGIGGGGGGGTSDRGEYSYNVASPSAGGNGIVAIRLHFS